MRPFFPFPFGAATASSSSSTPVSAPEVPRAGWIKVVGAPIPRFEHIYPQQGGAESQFVKVSPPPNSGWVTVTPLAVGPDIDFVIQVRSEFPAWTVTEANPVQIHTEPTEHP